MQLAIVSLVLLLLNTCSNSQSPNNVALDQQFNLKYHESVNLEKDQLKVRFTSILQDSRCPKGVQCIAAGSANIELELSTSKEEKSSVQLSTDSNSNEVTFEKYRIKLVDVSPYPNSGEQIDSTRYLATLVISKT